MKAVSFAALRSMPLVAGKRLWFAVAAVMAAAVIVGAATLGGALIGGQGSRSTTFEVSFPTSGEETELGSGTLPYDVYGHHQFNVSEPFLTAVTVRLEWQDLGRTPAQDPYVNLWFEFADDRNLSAIDEIQAPGGSISVEVVNPVPASATVAAAGEDEAIAMAMSSANNTTVGVGEWRVTVSTQAPSDVRPFVGGEVSYRVWVTLTFYKPQATRVGTT